LVARAQDPFDAPFGRFVAAFSLDAQGVSVRRIAKEKATAGFAEWPVRQRGCKGCAGRSV
jgi:hypothetical protein